MNSIPEGMRRCRGCGVVKPFTLEFFIKNSRVKCGIGAQCRQCRRAESIAYKKTPLGRQQNAEYLKRRYAKRKAQPPTQGTEKLCPNCKAVKPASEWGYNVGTADGFESWCNLCNAERAQAKRDRNPEYVARKLERERRIRENVAVCRYCQKEQKRTPENFVSVKGFVTTVCHSCNNERTAIYAKLLTPAEHRTKVKKQRGLCYWCHELLETKGQRDHVIPRSKGGSDDPSNIVIVCQSCNQRKAALMPDEWLAKIA